LSGVALTKNDASLSSGEKLTVGLDPAAGHGKCGTLLRGLERVEE
jgi:hypothetical protein